MYSVLFPKMEYQTIILASIPVLAVAAVAIKSYFKSSATVSYVKYLQDKKIMLDGELYVVLKGSIFKSSDTVSYVNYLRDKEIIHDGVLYVVLNSSITPCKNPDMSTQDPNTEVKWTKNEMDDFSYINDYDQMYRDVDIPQLQFKNIGTENGIAIIYDKIDKDFSSYFKVKIQLREAVAKNNYNYADWKWNFPTDKTYILAKSQNIKGTIHVKAIGNKNYLDAYVQHKLNI